MKPQYDGPPRLAERCLESLLSGQETREVIEDLRELFEHRRDTRGLARARLWYWRQVVSFAIRFRGRRRAAHATPRQLGTGFAQDVRYAARTLVRSPGFAVAALLTLALGIGASSAILERRSPCRSRSSRSSR